MIPSLLVIIITYYKLRKHFLDNKSMIEHLQLFPQNRLYEINDNLLSSIGYEFNHFIDEEETTLEKKLDDVISERTKIINESEKENNKIMKNYYNVVGSYQLDYESIDRKDGMKPLHKKIYDEIVDNPAKD